VGGIIFAVLPTPVLGGFSVVSLPPKPDYTYKKRVRNNHKQL
jgi:hypothetical protein